MDDLEEIRLILKEKLNNYPGKFVLKMRVTKKQFFGYLKEYREAVKYIPSNILENVESDVEEDQTEASTDTAKEKTPRVRKIEELREKLKAMKGKSLNVVDSLKRKGLKNRLKKKLKLEERMKKKTIANKGNKIKQIKDDETSGNVKLENGNKISETSNNRVLFSKFEFPEGLDEENKKKKKKGPTDPMRILQKVQKSQKKLREMETRGRIEKVKEIKEKLAWETVINKAGGQKVKDDVELLKKSITKKKNAKNRSKKKWEEREISKRQRMEEAQKKRKTNIQTKKKDKQKNKTKKLIKKARIAP